MKKLLIVALFVNAVLLAGRFFQELPVARGGPAPVSTENGDTNGDGARNIADAIYFLDWLFRSGPEPVALAQTSELTTEEVALLKEILPHLSVEQLVVLADKDGNVAETAKAIRFCGVNVQIVNGLGATNGNPDNPVLVGLEIEQKTNGLGNLIVGYNEHHFPGDPPDGPNPVLREAIRTGSHNIVTGTGNNYSTAGGLVVGLFNAISGHYASVSGGIGNTASGDFSSVSGGTAGTASGERASVSGGHSNTASGLLSSVSGGGDNTASGSRSSVSAGQQNGAIGRWSTVSGGRGNTASGGYSSISGGRGNTAAAGSSSISGGSSNVTGDPDNPGSGLPSQQGTEATVSGGQGLTATDPGQHLP